MTDVRLGTQELSATPGATRRRSRMTVLQKKPGNQIAHLSDADIENIGRELDAIRQDVMDSRGARDAAYIRRVIDVQRKLELGRRGVLPARRFPPACVVAAHDIR